MKSPAVMLARKAAVIVVLRIVVPPYAPIDTRCRDRLGPRSRSMLISVSAEREGTPSSADHDERGRLLLRLLEPLRVPRFDADRGRRRAQRGARALSALLA